MRLRLSLFMGVLCVAMWAGTALAADGEVVGRMSVMELSAKLDDPNIVVLDVRTGSSWTEAKRQIPGSLRYEPRKAGVWSRTLDPDKTYVLY